MTVNQCPISLTPDALRFRELLGLGVLPVIEKVPRIKGWQRGGLRALKSIEKVFGRFERDVADKITIGVPTGFQIEGGGYLLVMDVDARNGGEEALVNLPPLPETVTAQTNDGYHYWFRTKTPLPSMTRPDSIELKGAGSYVVVPPAPGRTWLRDPFTHDIAWAPEWLLSKPEPSKVAVAARELITTWHRPSTGETGILCQPSIPPVEGTRRRTLLSTAGLWNYRGWSTDQHKELLAKAGRAAGIEQSEINRILTYVFNTVPKSTNPAPAPNAYTGVVTHCSNLGFREKRVLLAALETFLQNGNWKHLRDKWEGIQNAWKDIISARYVAARTGIDHMSASRGLKRLVQAGMLWRSPKLRRLKSGFQAYQYRPTFVGLAFAAQHLGFDPGSATETLKYDAKL
jgi:Bifunctional DNA primase/polymerase, N-terminal